MKNIDWRVRKTEFIRTLPRETMYEILDNLGTAADRRELGNWNSTNPVDVKMEKKKTVMIVMPDRGASPLTASASLLPHGSRLSPNSSSRMVRTDIEAKSHLA